MLDLGIVRPADEDHRHAREQRGAGHAACAQQADQRHAAQQGATPLACGGESGEGDHDDELRQEQHRLGQDQAAGVETGVVVGEDVARDHDVGVGDGQEGQQRECAVQGLAQHGSARVIAVGRLVAPVPAAPQEERSQAGRHEQRDRHRRHRGALGRADQHRDQPDQKPGHPEGRVEHAQLRPPALALEDSRLSADDGERVGRGGEQQRGVDALQPEQVPHQGGEHQQRRGEHQSAGSGDAQHLPFDLGDGLGGGRDPPGRRGLHGQLQHPDDEQHGHQAGHCAVLRGPEQACCQHLERVGRDVHDADRDSQPGAAAQECAEAAAGRWLRHGA